MDDPIPLNLLPVGCLARVCQVIGDAEQVRRLHELGLRGGAEIEMIQSGSPCIIRLADHKLCFRGDELMQVLVQPGASN